MSTEIHHLFSLVVGLNFILIGILVVVEALVSHFRKKRVVSSSYSVLTLVAGPLLFFAGFQMVTKLFR